MGKRCMSVHNVNPCLAVNHAVLQSFHYRETGFKTQPLAVRWLISE